MFSMAVAALAKSLIVVTVPLHPAAAPPAPAHYTARPGDTLSGIARHEYGSAADWPALWWINRHAVPNPDVIAAGQRLRLSTWHPRPAWLDRAARAAIPAPAQPAERAHRGGGRKRWASASAARKNLACRDRLRGPHVRGPPARRRAASRRA